MKFKKLLALLMALALVLTSFSFAAAEEEIVEAPAADEVVEAAEEQAAVEESTDGAPEGEPEGQEAELPAVDSSYDMTMKVQYQVGDLTVNGADIALPENKTITAPTTVWADIVDLTTKLSLNDSIGYTADGWYLNEVKEANKIKNITAKNDDFADGATIIYNFNVNDVEVTFNAGENVTATVPTKKTVKYGAKILNGEQATRDGYDFAGWFKDAATTTAVGENDTAVAANGVEKTGDKNTITVFAKWTAKNYSITWEIEPAAEVEVKSGVTPANADYGDEIILPTVGAKDGYTAKYSGFSWKVNGEAFTGTKVTIKGETTITLVPTVNTFDVEFLDSTGTHEPVAETQKVSYDGDATIPDVRDAAPEGYDFDFWGDSATATQPIEAGWNTKIKAGKTVYAIWKVKSYKVNFFLDEDATKAIIEKSAEYNATVPALTEAEMKKVVKTGYTLDKTMPCYTLNEVGQKVAFVFADGANPTQIKGDTNVYANWTKNSYTIKLAVKGTNADGPATATYDNGTATGAAFSTFSKVLEFGGTLAETDLKGIKTTDLKYAFAGWTAIGSDDKAKAVTLPLTIDDTLKLGVNLSDVVLTATWNKLGVVTFDDPLNTGDDAIKPLQLELDADGEATIEKLPTPKAKEGYAFDGWYYEKDNKLVKAEDGMTVTFAGLALSARWYKVFTVKFNSVGGTPDVGSSLEPVELLSTVPVADGAQYSATFANNKKSLPVVTKTGYDFIGWFASSDVNADPITVNTEIIEDCTLTARWDAIEWPVTVNYDMAGEYDYTDSVLDGGKVAVPPEHEKAGFIFDGWHLVVGGKPVADEYDFNTPVTGEIELKAKWLTAEAQIGTTNYATLQEALDVGGNVKLLVDVKADADLTIKKETTLNLNQKTLNLDENTLLVEGAVLTIDGGKTAGTIKNGTLKTASNGSVEIKNGTFATLEYEGTGITITDGLFDTYKVGSAVLADSNKKLAQTTASKPYYTPDTFKTLTIAWNYEGATPATTAIQVGSEETPALVIDTLKAAKEFVEPTRTGWQSDDAYYYTDAACTKKYDKMNASLEQDTTVYVKWLIEVTFDTDNGQFNGDETIYKISSDRKTAIQLVEIGGLATQPYDPYKSGYGFKGWAYGEYGWLFDHEVTEPITLKATWTRGDSWAITNVDESYAGGYAIHEIWGAPIVDQNAPAQNVEPVFGGYRLVYSDFQNDKWESKTPLTFYKKEAEDGRAAGYYIKFTVEAPSSVKAKVGEGGGDQYYFKKDDGTPKKFNGTDGKYDTVDPKTGRLSMNIYERVDMKLLAQGGYNWTYTFYSEGEAESVTFSVSVYGANIEYYDGTTLESNKVRNVSKTDVRFSDNDRTMDGYWKVDEVFSGDALEQPKDPKKPDAIFLNWYELTKENYKFEDDGTPSVKDGHLVLKSTATPYDFTKKILIPAKVEEEETTQEPYFRTYMDLELVAEWQDTVTLTFMDGDKILGKVTKNKGATWADFAEELPSDKVVPGEGKIFVGWSEDGTRAKLVDFTSKDEVASSMNLRACYEQKVTVTFINGELVISEKDYGNNEKRSNVEQPEGFEIEKGGFLGWFEKDAAAPYDFTTTDTLVIGEDKHELILFAKFTEEYSTATLKSAKLMLEGKIQIAMKFLLPEDLLKSDIKVVFSNGAEYELSGLVKTEDNMYWFQTPVPIPEFDKDVTVSLKNSKGDVEFKVGDKTVTSFAYSVATWINNKKGGTDKDADIAKALEKYGQAAANRFLGGKYSISGLVDVEAEDAVVTGNKPAGVTKATQNVNFQEDNSLNVLFYLADGKTDADYTWTVPTGAKKTVEGNVVKITVPNIAAPNLDVKHTFAVSDGTDTYTIVTSVMTYAKRMATGKDNPKDPDLMKALYGYCVAAKAYFGQ